MFHFSFLPFHVFSLLSIIYLVFTPAITWSCTFMCTFFCRSCLPWLGKRQRDLQFIKSINQLTNQLASQPASQPASQSANQPVSQSVSQSVSRSVSQPVIQSVSQSVSQSVRRSVESNKFLKNRSVVCRYLTFWLVLDILMRYPVGGTP